MIPYAINMVPGGKVVHICTPGRFDDVLCGQAGLQSGRARTYEAVGDRPVCRHCLRRLNKTAEAVAERAEWFNTHGAPDLGET